MVLIPLSSGVISMVLGLIDRDGSDDESAFDVGFSRKLYKFGDELRRIKFWGLLSVIHDNVG